MFHLGFWIKNHGSRQKRWNNNVFRDYDIAKSNPNTTAEVVDDIKDKIQRAAAETYLFGHAFNSVEARKIKKRKLEERKLYFIWNTIK
jgi:hypothetical protein